MTGAPSDPAVVPHLRRRATGESGSATVELTGMAAVAAILVLALLLAATAAAPGIGDTFARAICRITTLGQGACGAPTSAAEHRPPTPCVVESDARSLRTGVDIIVVTAEDGRRFEVAQLSDGRYRVTLLEGGSVGLETGVGGGLTLTVNDRTVGGSALAEAGASLDMGNGRVWYTSDPAEVARMIDEDGEDAVEGTLLGNGGPARWVWERGQDAVGWVAGSGDYEFPEPDETYTEGGLSVNARAEATAVTERANAGAGITETLGVREVRDTSSTFYYRTTVEGEAGLQWLDGELQGAQLAGRLQLVTAVTYDSTGAMTSVAVSAVAAGESKGAVSALFGGSGDPSLQNNPAGATVYQAALPIRDAVDVDTANAFLVAMGASRAAGPGAVVVTAGAAGRLVEAALARGHTTKETYDLQETTEFAVDAEGKLGIELGGHVAVETTTQTISSAQYWDGRQWVNRTECTA